MFQSKGNGSNLIIKNFTLQQTAYQIAMIFAVMTLDLKLSDCRSLKEKRSLLKPLLHKLHKDFNVSASEVGAQDFWNESIVACSLVSTEKRAAESYLAQIPDFINKYFCKIEILSHAIQFF